MILYKNFLDKNFCKGIIEYGESQELEDARVGLGEDGATDEVIRRSKVHFMEGPFINAAPITDLYFNIERKLKEANAFHYGFDLHYLEAFQFTKYESGDEGFYDWHVDIFEEPASQRKLSCSLLLNDSTEFEGGSFEFRNPFDQKLTEAGDLLVFPSFEEHRVHPVTAGTRYSLVGWFRGPRHR